MIILQDFFDTLASGEFSNIALGSSALGTIEEEKYPDVVANMNLGLVELYKRFALKENEIKVYQQPGVSRYYLRPAHLTNINSLSSTLYLIADEDPFDDNLIKVVEAYNSNGEPIPINNKQFPETGIFTPSFDIVKMVPSTPPDVISLVYLASYPKIVVTEDFDPSTIELTFPSWIQEPLLAYIAARVFQGKTSKASEGEPRLYTTFMYQYEAACRKIELLGLDKDDEDTSSNFENNGWT